MKFQVQFLPSIKDPKTCRTPSCPRPKCFWRNCCTTSCESPTTTRTRSPPPRRMRFRRDSVRTSFGWGESEERRIRLWLCSTTPAIRTTGESRSENRLSDSRRSWSASERRSRILILRHSRRLWKRIDGKVCRNTISSAGKKILLFQHFHCIFHQNISSLADKETKTKQKTFLFSIKLHPQR